MAIIRNGTPVRVVNPQWENTKYKNQAGLVRDNTILWGGVMSYQVELDGNKRVWFDARELKVLR
ncbi:hypothetical protein SEA_PATELGO_159 [Streptomyces phage Patelgo]|nr:hypothetical protein SEA_PATELGO_159 [Streptomyces phage Patelgo]